MFGRVFRFNPGSRRSAMAPSPIILQQNSGQFSIKQVTLTDAQLRNPSGIVVIPAEDGYVNYPAFMAYVANITAGFSAARGIGLRFVGLGTNIMSASASAQIVDTAIRMNEWYTAFAPSPTLITSAAAGMENRSVELISTGAAVTGGSTLFGGRLRIGYYRIPLSESA